MFEFARLGIESFEFLVSLYVGLGLERLERAPEPVPVDHDAMMMTEDTSPRPTSAIILQVEVDMDLPRSIGE